MILQTIFCFICFPAILAAVKDKIDQMMTFYVILHVSFLFDKFTARKARPQFPNSI